MFAGSTPRKILLLLLLLPLAGCGNPSVLAFGRGLFFEQQADWHYDCEDPISKKGKKLYANAIEQYDAAIRLQPRYGDAFYHRGLCRLRSGDAGKALMDASEAVALNPNNIDGWKLRAESEVESFVYDKAAEDFAQAFNLSARKDVECLRGKASAEEKAGHLQEAMADLDLALSLKKSLPEVYCDRATCFRRLGDLKAMHDSFKSAVELSPHTPVIYQRRAYAEFIVEQYHPALDDFYIAIDTSRWRFSSCPYSIILGWHAAKFLGEDRYANELVERAINYWGIPVSSADDAHDAVVAERWPYPLMQFIHGDISAEKLLAAAGSDRNYMTEARCNIGLNAVHAGDRALAIASFQKVVKSGNPNFVEYEIAQRQLSGLLAKN